MPGWIVIDFLSTVVHTSQLFMHARPTIQAAMKRTRAAEEWTRRFGKIIYAGARLALLVIETVVLFS